MKQNFLMTYLLIVGVQMLICNYFHVSPYIVLNILPAAILCLPAEVGTAAAMVIAFASGLSIDLLAEGVLGLNTLALVPVAASRRFLCEAIFGEETTKFREDISMRKYGTAKVAFAITLLQTIFLTLYIWADGAAARPVIFSILRFAASLTASTLASLVIANLLDPNERK